MAGVSPIPPKAVGAGKQGGSVAVAPAVNPSKIWRRDGDVVYDTQDWRYGMAVSSAGSHFRRLHDLKPF